jgi:hypothetical protein
LAAAWIEAAHVLREAEDRAGGAQSQSRQPRQYCKAFYLKDLRQFSGWSESRINWHDPGDNTTAEEREAPGFSDQDVVFLHQDLTVTQSMWHNENVLFQQRTPAWEAFCTTVLRFQVPDDFDLVGKRPA